MAQTREGATKIAAGKAGVSVEEYLQLRESGKKWCMRCRGWHPTSEFGNDRARYDGLDASCRDSRNQMQRDLHPKVKPEDRKKMGPPRYASRSGDKKQARHIVNLHVRFGRLPKPNTVP